MDGTLLGVIIGVVLILILIRGVGIVFSRRAARNTYWNGMMAEARTNGTVRVVGIPRHYCLVLISKQSHDDLNKFI